MANTSNEFEGLSFMIAVYKAINSVANNKSEAVVITKKGDKITIKEATKITEYKFVIKE